jgi:hypothetical protein
MTDAVLPVLAHWERTLRDLLGRTQKLPRKVRFTFSDRIDNLALDVYEALVEAKYSRDKVAILRRANLDIEKLRLLLRLCHDERYLDRRGFEHVALGLDEAGRMVGGWIKERQRR